MRIVFIGAGNLATNLAHAMYTRGYQVPQVFSRTQQSASRLAEKVNATAIHNIGELHRDADLYIIALKDDALQSVKRQLPDVSGIYAHTAGSVSIEELKGFVKNYGVFYPLQTFNKERLVEFTHIPVCIEANTQKNLKVLHRVAANISEEVHEMNSGDRLALHVAAVFACNFTNFMLAGAEEILHRHQIPFSILKPLIQETIDKTHQHSPKQVQTGPARRGDRTTIKRHMDLLSHNENLRKIYSFVTDAMMEFYNSESDQ